MKIIKEYYQYVFFIFILTSYILFRMSDVTQFTNATQYFSLTLFFVFVVILGVSIFLKSTPSSLLKQINEWVLFISVSLSFILLIFSFVIIPSNVNQQSMMPTLNDGDRILIFHFNYEPQRGDIIVIEVNHEDYPMIPLSTFRDSETVFFVKRLVGLPGDRIHFELENGQSYLYINDEKVLSVSGHGYLVTEQQQLWIRSQLEDGILQQYFVLGDNSTSSLDSIEFGHVNPFDIMGKVIFRLWPFGGLYE
jgi:signal peptidase I